MREVVSLSLSCMLALVCVSAMTEEEVGSLNPRPVIGSVGNSWMVCSLGIGVRSMTRKWINRDSSTTRLCHLRVLSRGVTKCRIMLSTRPITFEV